MSTESLKELKVLRAMYAEWELKHGGEDVLKEKIEEKIEDKRGFQYTEEMLKEISILSGKGFTKYQIADYYGIKPNTLSMHIRRFPEIDRAFRKGKSKALALVSTHLFQQIKDGSTVATIFYLKTQAGWSSKTEEDMIEYDEKPDIKLGTIDPIDASKAYQEIMLRGKD